VNGEAMKTLRVLSGSARVRAWAAAGLLLVVAAFVLLSLLGDSLSRASHAPTLSELIKPTVVSQKTLAVARPFDSNPFPTFVPTRVAEVTLERYPLEKAYEQAALLDIPFPSTLRVVECEGAMFVNRMWHDGYTINLTCGHPRPAPGSGVAVVDRHLAIGYDPAHITFQHDMITGLSHAAFFLDWALQRPESRGVLCHKVVCEVLRAAGTSLPAERASMPKLFWAPSIRYNRAPNDTTMDGCEPFPLGSFWPMELFLQQIRSRGKLKPPKSEAPTILYLSRGSKSTSIRFLDNEEAFVAHLKDFAKPRGWRVEVLPHEQVAVSVATTSTATISRFYHAAAVVGLHGGAFSNIVFCHKRAVIVEINNNVKARS
jgi:hypothetical protein